MPKRRTFDARHSISALKKRIGVLENHVRELQKAEHGELLHELIPLPSKKKRGRKPKVQLQLIADRDAIVRVLEAHWPELRPALLAPQNPDRIRTRLMLLAKSANQRDVCWVNHLLNAAVFAPMLEFLKSDRFRGNPRQLANAMAGVPLVSWWRSLRICEAQPCLSYIGERALKDYIRRKHPRLFAELELCGNDLMEIANALKRYRSKDRELSLLRRNASFAKQLMNEEV